MQCRIWYDLGPISYQPCSIFCTQSTFYSETYFWNTGEKVRRLWIIMVYWLLSIKLIFDLIQRKIWWFRMSLLKAIPFSPLSPPTEISTLNNWLCLVFIESRHVLPIEQMFCFTFVAKQMETSKLNISESKHQRIDHYYTTSLFGAYLLK